MKIKFVVSLLVVLLIISIILPIENSADFSFGQTVSNINTGADGKVEDQTEVLNIVVSILNIARIIGTGVAILMLAILGTKYMMASAGERAEIKKHAIVYVVGAIVLFGSSAILGIVKNFAEANLS